ncbi:(deoxy)nucleoside triphosphate pyrophosphohydrolase [Legionella nagasakiensis]|uniref:(deoxy)nucleoside triphosphate pyrophosphohydrolase n=1 Tax=Legionella nagasakiensis TaxID=535290 RepID=UPI0010557CCA|nr:(deoxy)nucleoside triphosphate pyrophosphohydrolase [Legionella nagasakiensis]
MKVAVAVIVDAKQRILITKRPAHVSHGGFWEFPGGKLEEGESPASALIREIKEEVGLDVIDYHFLGDVRYVYDQREVNLLIYHVSRFTGQAVCRESQMDLCWAETASLSQFEFPAANVDIIHLIRQNLYPEMPA